MASFMAGLTIDQQDGWSSEQHSILRFGCKEDRRVRPVDGVFIYFVSDLWWQAQKRGGEAIEDSTTGDSSCGSHGKCGI